MHRRAHPSERPIRGALQYNGVVHCVRTVDEFMHLCMSVLAPLRNCLLSFRNLVNADSYRENGGENVRANVRDVQWLLPPCVLLYTVYFDGVLLSTQKLA